MFSCCGLPTEMIRWAVCAVLLGVSVFVVLRKDRRAGLIIGAGALLDLIAGIAVPVLEIIGISLIGSQGGGDSLVWIFFVFALLGPLSRAVNLACFTIGLVMLARRLPDEEREDW